MLKRDLAGIAGPPTDIDGPRTKRRRDAGVASSPPADGQAAGGTADVKKEAKGAVAEEDEERVREVGRALWETVKNAVDKE